MSQLYTHQAPFANIRNDAAVIKYVLLGATPPHPDNAAHVMPPQVQLTVNACLSFKAADRATMDSVARRLSQSPTDSDPL
jgi:hypothetical protein